MEDKDELKSASLIKRLLNRRASRVVAGAIVLLFVMGYIILPFALDRLDGTTKALGSLPESIVPEGKQVLQTQFLKLNEGTIAYDDSGTSGPLVVCIPSMGDLRQEYRFLSPQLAAAGFRVVTMDVRGHGESSVEWPDYSAAAIGSDIIALVSHLNSGPAFIIGTSMAGGASVWAAAESPELIAGQVLIDAFVRDYPSKFMDNMLIQLALAKPWGASVWSMVYESLYPTAPPADQSVYRGVLKANLREPGRFAAFRKMIAASKADCGARLDEVNTPTLVIMGTKDPDFKQMGPETAARWLTDRLHGTLYMVEGAGHYPHAEMPEQVGPEIIAFLKQHNL